MKRLILLTLFVLWSVLTAALSAGEVHAQWRPSAPVPAPTSPRLRQFTLSIGVDGNGTGVVGPMACSRNCNRNYLEGMRLLLFATPMPDSVFAGWNGACTGTGTCALTMNRNEFVTATFVRPTLRVSRDGSGTGRVSSNPPGISDCGTDCDEVYPPNMPVTLAAHNGTGVFAGWRGPCTIVKDDCVVRMNGNRNVVATFERPRLRVITGAGRVTSNIAGINCGDDCEERFDNGRKVTLEAKPDDGFSFYRWEGNCESENGRFCTVSMDTLEKNVTAVFGRPRHNWDLGNIVGPPTGVVVLKREVRLITPSSKTVKPTDHATYDIVIDRTNFSGQVDLSVASISPIQGTFAGGAPPTASLAPSSTTGNNSTLTISNTNTTGEFIVRISATASNISINPIDVLLTVQRMVAGARKECTGRTEQPFTLIDDPDRLPNRFRLDYEQRVTVVWQPRWFPCPSDLSRSADRYTWFLKKVDTNGNVVLQRVTTTNQQTLKLEAGDWEIYLGEGITAPGWYRVLIP